MIKSFSCNGFRNINCDNVEFERINILIGPNNSGKSNFIRALSFAANMVNNPKIESSFFLSEVKRNGWNQLADRHNKNLLYSFLWEFELDKDRPVEYTLKAQTGKNRDNNYLIQESLNSSELRGGCKSPYNYFSCHDETPGTGIFSTAGLCKEKNNRIIAQVDRTESVLLQMDDLFFSNKELFSKPFVRDNIRQVLESMRKYFRGFFSYSCTAFNISAIRDLHDTQDNGTKLNKDGANFVNVFYHMMNIDKQFKERYCKMMKKLITNCEDIIIDEAGGKIWMELIMDGCSFPLSEVSDGTIHLLILLLLLNIPAEDATSLLAIDEPEMNLHPAWQKQLANEILRCQGFKQCFISTHSPDFLDEFTEDFLNGNAAVLVFDPSKKKAIRKLDCHELNDDLQHWTLGDLYRIGDPMIGGWPQ